MTLTPLLIKNNSNIEIYSKSDVAVTVHDTPYSHRKELHWHNVQKSASGNYVCRANIISDDTIDEKNWELRVMDPFKPIIAETTIVRSTEKHALGEPFQLMCRFDGLPRPDIHWYRDDIEMIPEANDTHVTIDNNNTLLNIHYVKMEDQAKYRCQGSNRYGSEYRETTLKITGTTATIISKHADFSNIIFLCFIL